MEQKKINVFGGGLAGCEAAYQAAKRGVYVDLYEMKPQKMTPAHTSDNLAELVCSNSLRSNCLTNAVGLLKEELNLMDSLIMQAAYATQVEAGSALAVDRHKFSEYITKEIKSNPFINVIEQEITSIPEDEISVVATGPLTSDIFSHYLEEYLGKSHLSFFDASAPIVEYSSLDMNKIYAASRYGKGEASYLNCPMTKEEYDVFYENLINAEEAQLKEFDKDSQKKPNVFEGCMPVEVMARRGYDTLRYGPLKPVGLPDPKTGKEPYAVIQLRQENAEKTMYNLVGFQTHLTFGEQKRVFSMIPGLENANFLRYGVMHRNTFINSPKCLNQFYSMREKPNVFFAGQMTGVEGYVESTSSGFVAGVNAARYAKGESLIDFPNITAIGALAHYISDENVVNFQPMNANFGLVANLEQKVKGGKRFRNEALANRSLEYINIIKSEI
ncbi:MAG: methylenetetrahydrofolate--tRNA-(uracil(54)-C(5))-methyltransferase (FADH(2)-oxidizing) TrmFO [Ruminococcaceae bacterium]|nr:methylenetetrahydrofolate--tRNA-(uracil(54)-C(5))-methyltransferase (FADH(2)-oxidizing) TrmFO [Oscillospiraceae bacterium]